MRETATSLSTLACLRCRQPALLDVGSIWPFCPFFPDCFEWVPAGGVSGSLCVGPRSGSRLVEDVGRCCRVQFKPRHALISAVRFRLRLVNSAISIWIFALDRCYLCEHVFGLTTGSRKQFGGETKDLAAKQRRNQQDGVGSRHSSAFPLACFGPFRADGRCIKEAAKSRTKESRKCWCYREKQARRFGSVTM